MAVWVEQARWVRNEINCGHLVGDDLDSLHALAAVIELEKAKFFNRHALIPHYSIPEALIPLALEAGAIELGQKDRERVLGRVLSIMASRDRPAVERGNDALPRRRKGQQSMFEI